MHSGQISVRIYRVLIGPLKCGDLLSGVLPILILIVFISILLLLLYFFSLIIS